MKLIRILLIAFAVFIVIGFFEPRLVVIFTGSEAYMSQVNFIGTKMAKSTAFTFEEAKKIYHIQRIIVYCLIYSFYVLSFIVLYKSCKSSNVSFFKVMGTKVFIIALFLFSMPPWVVFTAVTLFVYSGIFNIIISSALWVNYKLYKTLDGLMKVKINCFLALCLCTFFLSGYKPSPEPRWRRHCYSNIRVIQNAVEMYNERSGSRMTELDLDLLVKEGFLRDIPECPKNKTGSPYIIIDTSAFPKVLVSCGDMPEGEGSYYDMKHGTISGQYKTVTIRSLYGVFLDIWLDRPPLYD